MIRKLLIAFFSCLGLISQAQNETAAVTGPQMADVFRQDGKIYVVIAVIGIVFVFVIALLIYIERKLKGLEKKLGEKIK